MKVYGSKSGKRVAGREDVQSAGKSKKVKKRSAGRAVLIVFLCIIGVVGITALALRLYVREPGGDGGILPFLPSTSSGTEPDSNDPNAPTPSGGSSNVASVNLKQREGTRSILLVGQNSGMTDTLMVATIDTKNKTCYVMSIPRDTVVECERRVKKINGAYSAGGSKEKGMEQLLSEVGSIIGFIPSDYACVGMTAFVKLVNAVGGVEFNVPVNMSVPAEGISLSKGVQTLNGDKALQLVRYRGYKDSDYGRIHTQQQFLTALGKKCVKNWTKLPEYLEIAQEYLLSDLDYGNMAWYAEQVNNIGMENVEFVTLPTSSVRYPKELKYGEWYEVIKSVEALVLINKTINPFNGDITKDNVLHKVVTEK